MDKQGYKSNHCVLTGIIVKIIKVFLWHTKCVSNNMSLSHHLIYSLYQ